MSKSKYPYLTQYNVEDQETIRTFHRESVRAINDILKGKINTGGTITLTYTGNGSNTTTVTDPLCNANSIPLIVPTNLLGAQALSKLYITSITAGSFVVNWNETSAGITNGNPGTLSYILVG